MGNLTAVRDFSDVRDMVRAYWLALTCGQPGEVYNIGSGQGRSIDDLLHGLLALSDTKFTIEQDPARMRPSDVPESVCDASKLHAATGWQPEISFEQSLHDILSDWRERVRQPRGSYTPDE